MKWQIQEAKNKLSEVIETSLHDGPQVITKHGKDTAIIMSYAEYKHQIASNINLKKTLMSSGFDQLDLERDPANSGRATDFVL